MCRRTARLKRPCAQYYAIRSVGKHTSWCTTHNDAAETFVYTLKTTRLEESLCGLKTSLNGVNREEEQTCKVVLPPSGLSLDKFWIWRALPKLFAPNQVGGSA